MPNYSGAWTLSAQFQAVGGGTWAPSNPYFILYGGVAGTSGSFAVGGSVLASQEGTVAITTLNGSLVSQNTFISNTGAVILSKSFSSGTATPCAVSSSVTNPVWYHYLQNNYYNSISNNALTTWNMPLGVSAQGSTAAESNQLAVSPNGTIAVVSTVPGGKVQYPDIILYTPAPAFIDGRYMNDSTKLATQYAKVFARTDNTFTWMYTNGTSFKYWTVTPPSAIPPGGINYTGGGTSSNYRQGCSDSLNNIYMVSAVTAYANISVLKINSSPIPTNWITWNVTSGIYNGYNLNGQYLTSITQYGDYLYLCAGATSSSAPVIGIFFVICLKSSDLTFVWGKSFSSADWGVGVNTYTGPLGGGTTSLTISANQYGVWVPWSAGTTTVSTQQTYLMKLPLNGGIANGTYVVNSKNLVIADYTPTLVVNTPPITYATLASSFTVRSSLTTTNPTISAGTLPSPVKTTLTAT